MHVENSQLVLVVSNLDRYAVGSKAVCYSTCWTRQTRAVGIKIDQVLQDSVYVAPQRSALIDLQTTTLMLVTVSLLVVRVAIEQ